MGKRWIALALVAACLWLGACNAQQQNTEPSAPVETQPVEETTIAVVQQPTVGISLPREDAFWKSQGMLLTRHLEDIGYDVILQYAAGDPKVQQSQLQELILRQVDCIVVTAVDTYALENSLKQAKNAKIPVVGYDRLPMHTDGVAFCVQPDSFSLGQQLAQYIIDTQLPEGVKSKTIEFFMGAPENENALSFYRGAMELLKPYLDSGKLVCKSKRTGFEDTAIPGESLQAAFEQCYEYMEENYEKSRPDILFCSSDALAQGCVYALEKFPERVEKKYPVIVSAGGSVETVATIGAGKQTACLYVDRNEQAKQCAKLVYHFLLQEQLPESVPHHNGVKEIPCYHAAGQLVDASSYLELLVAPGVYTQDQLDASLLEENRPQVTLPATTRPGTLPPPPTKPPVPTETAPPETTAPSTTPTETTPGETTAPETRPPETTTPPETTPPATEPPQTTPTGE